MKTITVTKVAIESIPTIGDDDDYLHQYYPFVHRGAVAVCGYVSTHDGPTYTQSEAERSGKPLCPRCKRRPR